MKGVISKRTKTYTFNSNKFDDFRHPCHHKMDRSRRVGGVVGATGAWGYLRDINNQDGRPFHRRRALPGAFHWLHL